MERLMHVELVKQDDWVTEPRRFEQRIQANGDRPVQSEQEQKVSKPPPDWQSELLESLLSALATLEQLSVRVVQILRALTPSAGETPRPRTILWLVLVDLILGQCARYLVVHFDAHITARAPCLLETYCFQIVDRSLRWLNDWPVGLKLNTPLSEFYCSTLGSIVRGWGGEYWLLIPSVKRDVAFVVGLVASISNLGLTFTLSATLDLLTILTLHLRLCWIVTRSLCLWQLESLSGLWNLFRGKRWNILRKRTDSYAYDVDQLFLGTLFFTVSIFLFPTVLVYASLFGMIRAIIWTASWALKLPVMVLNGLPLKQVSAGA